MSNQSNNNNNVVYKPMGLGMEVYGIDLKSDLSPDTIEQIKRDTLKYRMLILKNQGVISGERHVEISKWFGEIESTFYKHPRSPHPEVFRVSNDKNEGCRNVGRTGWHVDGFFMKAPFDFSIYHMVKVPKVGWTAFIGFKELLDSLTQEQRDRWNRLWLVGMDGKKSVVHPLVYNHPETKLPVMNMHLGLIDCFVWDLHSENQRVTDEEETLALLKEIHHEIVKDDERLIYKHNWQEGEFVFSDNRAVGHEATPETQLPVAEVGLRILHRVTIAGKIPPSKA